MSQKSLDKFLSKLTEDVNEPLSGEDLQDDGFNDMNTDPENLLDGFIKDLEVPDDYESPPDGSDIQSYIYDDEELESHSNNIEMGSLDDGNETDNYDELNQYASKIEQV